MDISRRNRIGTPLGMVAVYYHPRKAIHRSATIKGQRGHWHGAINLPCILRAREDIKEMRAQGVIRIGNRTRPLLCN